MKNMKILICVAVVLAGFISAVAQERSIDKSEFERVVGDSSYPYVKWKGKGFKATIRTEARLVGPAKLPDGTTWSMEHSSKTVTEFAAGGGYRQSAETSDKGNTKRSETIRVGDVVYSRTGEEAWKKRAAGTPSPYTPPAEQATPFEDIDTVREYKYLGTEIVGSATVQTYLSTTKKKSVDKAKGTDYTTVSTTKYWIDKDGTMVKSEFRSNGTGVDRSSYTGVFMEFVLDPSISVVAPDVP
jgi:hypothetical protein